MLRHFTAGQMTAQAPSPDPAAPLVGVIMGSQSDWATMRGAADMLDALGVPIGRGGRRGAPFRAAHRLHREMVARHGRLTRAQGRARARR